MVKVIDKVKRYKGSAFSEGTVWDSIYQKNARNVVAAEKEKAVTAAKRRKRISAEHEKRDAGKTRRYAHKARTAAAKKRR